MFKKTFIAVSILTVLGMLVSGYAHLINPNNFKIASIVGIAFPFLFSLNFLWLVLWGITRKIWIIVPLLGLILNCGSIKKTFSFSAPAKTVNEVSIMTWNVKNFDLYNWSHNAETRENMFQLLEDENPDILCLQEFYHSDKKNGFKNIDDLKKRLNYKYYHFEKFYTKDTKRHWGIATFSKYPIEKKQAIHFENSGKINGGIVSDIVINDTTVRVFNIHLQSNSLQEEDYEYLDDLAENQKPNMQASKAIASKLNAGAKKRVNQAIKIYNWVDTYDGRKIIAGDFNDTPLSYSYDIISKNMVNAYQKKGWGFGKTYVNKTPFFRIDHILLDSHFEINRSQVIKKAYSDHYPVICYFEL